MSREIMQQALEAFEEIMFTKNVGSSHIIAKNARHALREELAKPEQEPVAWMRNDRERVCLHEDKPAYPNNEERYSIPLYATPTKREWVGLTDDELNNISEYGNTDWTKRKSLARAIEAKLREKNG